MAQWLGEAELLDLRSAKAACVVQQGGSSHAWPGVKGGDVRRGERGVYYQQKIVSVCDETNPRLANFARGRGDHTRQAQRSYTLGVGPAGWRTPTEE